MFRFNRTFAPTTPDLQPHHQERLISIMASIQVDSPTGNLRYFREGCFDNLKLVDEKAWDLEMINDDDEESDLGE
ncbi:unnamed protein product [Prunus brigantina]